MSREEVIALLKDAHDNDLTRIHSNYEEDADGIICNARWDCAEKIRKAVALLQAKEVDPEPTHLMKGTRIRFLRTLDAPPTSDCPACVYAYEGETGTIIEVGGCKEGYWVKTDSWQGKFGCESKDFALLEAKPEQYCNPVPSNAELPNMIDNCAELQAKEAEPHREASQTGEPTELEAIKIIQKSIATHESWAEFLETHPEYEQKDECKHLGDAKFHRESISLYNRAIRGINRLTAELAEAKKKPKPGEFTSKLRTAWRSQGYAVGDGPVKPLVEACDLIDAKDETIDRLTAELEDWRNEQARRIVDLEAEIKRLKAELERLKNKVSALQAAPGKQVTDGS